MNLVVCRAELRSGTKFKPRHIESWGSSLCLSLRHSVSPPHLHHRLNSELLCPFTCCCINLEHTSKIPSYVLALFKPHIIGKPFLITSANTHSIILHLNMPSVYLWYLQSLFYLLLLFLPDPSRMQVPQGQRPCVSYSPWLPQRWVDIQWIFVGWMNKWAEKESQSKDCGIVLSKLACFTCQ